MTRLDEICSLNMGQSPDSSSYNETGDGIPFFQGNADFGELHPTVRVWCNAPTKIAHSGDILISVRAPIGALNIADRDCCIGRGLAALTVNETICSKGYIWYAIANKVDELNSKGTGSTFKAINKNALGETEIPLPTLDRQHQVSAILDKLSAVISLRKQQLSKLDELVKARFVEMFETHSESFPFIELGNVAKLQGGYAFKSFDYVESGIRLVQIANVNKDVLDWDICNYVPESFLSKYKAFSLQVDDIVLAMTRPVIKSLNSVKVAKITMEDVPSLLNQRVGRFVIDKSKINSAYLIALCQTSNFREYVEAMSGNSLQPNISSKQVEKYRIKLPPLEVQNKFAEYVGEISKQKLTIQQSLDKLEVLKKSLMQEYFG